MNFSETQIGKPHLLWQIIGSSVTEVKRSIAHCRIATGTYLLQSNISKFSNKQEDPTCPLCEMGTKIPYICSPTVICCTRNVKFTIQN
jgi:hypothetical protein